MKSENYMDLTYRYPEGYQKSNFSMILAPRCVNYLLSIVFFVSHVQQIFINFIIIVVTILMTEQIGKGKKE